MKRPPETKADALRELARAEAQLIKAEHNLLESMRARGGSEASLNYLRAMFRKHSGRAYQ
jgi:hypothetical protein